MIMSVPQALNAETNFSIKDARDSLPKDLKILAT